ncbi:EAL domain-containing protein [Persephonella sp.]
MRKVYITIILAILFSLGSILFNDFTRKYMEQTAVTLSLIKDIESLEYQLNNEILRNSFLLYYNHDIIYDITERIYKKIETLKKGYLTKDKYRETYKYLLAFENAFKEKEEYIYDFETINSIIKNTQTYIPSLILRYIEISGKKNDEYFYLISSIASSIFLAKSSLDEDFIYDLEKKIERLENFKFKDQKLKEFNEVYLSHIKIFIENFPKYQYILDYILNKKKDLYFLSETKKTFIKSSKEETKFITFFATFSSITFLTVLAIVAYLMISLDKKNITLLKLKKNLEKSLISDELTGLPNRFAFNIDKKVIKDPAFILVNIDNFKQINDFYGTDVGDFILVKVGEIISDFIKEKSIKGTVYRIGADDFGILIEDSQENIEHITKQIITRIEKYKFKLLNIDLAVNVSAGVSLESPLFEKADMALKHIKKQRKKYLIYNDSLDLAKKIGNNLKILSSIKYALENDKLFLVCQPIKSVKEDMTKKYEVLVRLLDEKGNTLEPQIFLPIAKESGYYGYITKTVIDKTLKLLEEYPYEFSLNISIEDIMDPDIKEYIYEKIIIKRELAERLTFEILESESAGNYEESNEFVKKVKMCGVKIAIDDFGSGYSNFAHVLNLEPDYLKIDASLIKNLDKDIYSQVVVSTIVTFANRLGIKTVAEFVHNESIYEIVKDMNIDYAQGFYIGRPVDKLS